MERELLSVRSLTKSYRGSTVVDDFSLSIAAGEAITLFGPNGSGKSTLLRLLLDFEQADCGEIHTSLCLRRDVGYVPQKYRESLLPWLSVKENILLPLRIRKVSRRQCEYALRTLTTLLSLEIDFSQRIQNLSGGQAQLVALYRASIGSPRLLILDEPTAALDHFNRQQFLQQVRALKEKTGCSVIAVLHDLNDALFLSDKLVLVSNAANRPSYVTLRRESFQSTNGRKKAYALSGLTYRDHHNTTQQTSNRTSEQKTA